MPTVVQTEAFRDWLVALKDRRAAARVLVRVSRMETGNPGDVKAVGEGVCEARIDYGPGYRVYFATRGKVLIVLLVGGDKSTQTSRPRKRCGRHGKERTMTKIKTVPSDAADFINTPEDVANFLQAAFDEAFEANDPGFIAQALGIVARSKGMTQIADKTGRSREQLYKSLSIDGNPTLATTISVMRELGVKLTTEAA